MPNHCVSGTDWDPVNTVINVTFELPQTGYMFIPFTSFLLVFNPFSLKKKKRGYQHKIRNKMVSSCFISVKFLLLLETEKSWAMFLCLAREERHFSPSLLSSPSCIYHKHLAFSGYFQEF